MWFIRWIVIVILIAAVLGFAFQNQHDQVVIRFLRWQSREIPLYLALFAAFAVGMITFLIIALFSHLKALSDLSKEKHARKKAEEKLEKVQQELNQLRISVSTTDQPPVI